MKLLRPILYILLFVFPLMGKGEDKQTKQQTPQEREEEFQRQLEQRLKETQKSVDQMLQSDDFKMLEKRMHQLLDSFGAWDDLNMDDLLDQAYQNPFEQLENSAMSGVERNWSENAQERILTIKTAKNSSQPLNITVDNGVIKITGSTLIEKKDDKGRVVAKSYSSVNLSESIPGDVDPQSVRYDQDKKGNIQVIFKKKIAGSGNSIRNTPPKQDSKKSLRPLQPEKDDITI